eukprot:scaffold430842_cov39-Prasinocladus_malaysianus.AAC.1
MEIRRGARGARVAGGVHEAGEVVRRALRQGPDHHRLAAVRDPDLPGADKNVAQGLAHVAALELGGRQARAVLGDLGPLPPRHLDRQNNTIRSRSHDKYRQTHDVTS